MAQELLVKAREILDEVIERLDGRSTKNPDETFSEFREILNARQKAGKEELDGQTPRSSEAQSSSNGSGKSEETFNENEQGAVGLASSEIKGKAEDAQGSTTESADSDEWETY